MYGVVILNYNVAKDALIAANSVVNCAEKEDYRICIVDNASSKGNEQEILKEGANAIPHTDLLFLNDNRGYAHGNNEGVKYLMGKYDLDYIVIMNPDVEIRVKGTIDRLLDAIDGTKYCGVQPIVWTQSMKGKKENLTSIRRVYSYADCLIENNFLLKRTFKERSKHQVYYEQRPYKENIEFDVPSGAFFIVKTSLIKELGELFDDRTFLYSEEIILGYRLKKLNLKMLFVPSEYVIHEGGKSIGSNSKKVTKFAVREELKSTELYLRDYLKCNSIQIALVKVVKWIDYYIKTLSYKIKK